MDRPLSGSPFRPNRIFYGCISSRPLGHIAHSLHQHVCAPHTTTPAAFRQAHPADGVQPNSGVCGLENSGNSCYLNAVLQCLSATMPLVEQLLHSDTRKGLARSKCRVSEVFVHLLEKMWMGTGSSCSPLEVMSALCSVLPQFNNDSQQDAQELLLLLLNTLHDDFNKPARMEQIKGCSPHSNLVTRLFEGQLSYMCICMHCHHQAHNTQAFTVLSLPVPKGTIKCSIQDCLTLFFKQTVLTGGEQAMCSVCGLKRETAITAGAKQFWMNIRNHLFHLVCRFGSKGKSQVKLRTNVLFLTKLDLSQFLSGLVPNESSYHLYAVVNHTGHLNMGHYTALCYNSLAQTWHCFDDAAVCEVQEDRVQSPNAYLLFYSHKPFHRPRIAGL
uniref:Ubiquitin carboxyl-terminal hydrolase n=1 Tax=Oryzias sinensis TaxID=183150 RepID=A0A8C7V6E4_9TELE